MENKEDWKRLEREQKIKDSDIIQKYGFDIKKYTEKILNKEYRYKKNKQWRWIKLTVILLIILLIIIQINSLNETLKNRERENIVNYIKKYYNEETEIIYEKTNWRGKGFVALKMKNEPNLEIHAVVDEEDISIDLDERLYKYYFEKWVYKNKSKFVVNENYEDFTYKNKRKKNWKLNYYTYIEVNNYEEMLKATEDIINFIEYTGNRTLLMGSYIKVNDKLIMPHGKPNESNEEIIENAKWQYERIVN